MLMSGDDWKAVDENGVPCTTFQDFFQDWSMCVGPTVAWDDGDDDTNSKGNGPRIVGQG